MMMMMMMIIINGRLDTMSLRRSNSNMDTVMCPRIMNITNRSAIGWSRHSKTTNEVSYHNKVNYLSRTTHERMAVLKMIGFECGTERREMLWFIRYGELRLFQRQHLYISYYVKAIHLLSLTSVLLHLKT